MRSNGYEIDIARLTGSTTEYEGRLDGSRSALSMISVIASSNLLLSGSILVYKGCIKTSLALS